MQMKLLKLINTYFYQNQPEYYLLELVPGNDSNSIGSVWTSVARTNELHSSAFGKGTKKVYQMTKPARDATRYSLGPQRVRVAPFATLRWLG